MNKVIAINLNGNAYQLDEDGYHALRDYLDRWAAELKDNPDKAEIMSDLEQAIAEKCQQFLRSHKTVVTGAEVGQIIAMMGPADGGSGAGAKQGEPQPDAGTADSKAPKRLYQIREGAMIGGVCNGMAAYFNVDVTVVRVIFVVLALITSGVWAIAYLIMMAVIPEAKTSEDLAAAHGAPFNAQQLIEQAKKRYGEFADRTEWKKHWRRQRRQWRKEWRHHVQAQPFAPPPGAAPGAPVGYATQIVAGLMMPLLGILNAVVFVAFLLALLSLLSDGAIFGWLPPPGMPLWVGILLLFLVYHMVATPLRAARNAATHYAHGGHPYGWSSVLYGVMWLGFTVLLMWLAYQYLPGVAGMFQDLPGSWNDLTRQPLERL